MPSKQLTVFVKDYDKLQKNLQKINDSATKAVQNTVNDIRRRAPGWVAASVTDVYNIKKSEITPVNKNSKKTVKKAGDIYVSGDTIDNLLLVYRGHLLTPTHFGMRPKQRPLGKKYKVTAQFFKGRTAGLGSAVFLGSGNGSQQIPFRRVGNNRLPIRPIKTLSLPQAVSNDSVQVKITERLTQNTRERLNHNLERCLRGKSR